MAEQHLCLCYKSQKEPDLPCPHKAIKGSKYCGVHTRSGCKKNSVLRQPIQTKEQPHGIRTSFVMSPPTRHASPHKVSLFPPFSETNYDQDWTQHASIIEKNGYSVILVPKGTIFYVGSDPKEFHKRHYFATLKIAMFYAYWGEKGRTHHVVYVMITTRDLFLFDATNAKNFEQLHQQFVNDPESDSADSVLIGKIPMFLNKDVFHYAFRNGQKRQSHAQIDDVTMYWLCANLGLDGFGITRMGQWHDEIAICDPSHSLEMLPYTFVRPKEDIDETDDDDDEEEVEQKVSLMFQDHEVRSFPLDSFRRT